jgi:hypothetical protein
MFYFKSKQQKHEVLDAELAANSDRIKVVLNMDKSKFQNLIFRRFFHLLHSRDTPSTRQLLLNFLFLS